MGRGVGMKRGDGEGLMVRDDGEGLMGSQQVTVRA